jgi:hypothetical protein
MAMTDRDRLAEIKARWHHKDCEGVAYLGDDGDCDERAGPDMGWLIAGMERLLEREARLEAAVSAGAPWRQPHD